MIKLLPLLILVLDPIGHALGMPCFAGMFMELTTAPLLRQ